MSDFDLHELLARRRYRANDGPPLFSPEELLERALVTYPEQDVPSEVIADALVEMFRRIEAADATISSLRDQVVEQAEALTALRMEYAESGVGYAGVIKVWLVENQSGEVSTWLGVRKQLNRSFGTAWPEFFWSPNPDEGIRFADKESARKMQLYLTGWKISEDAKMTVTETSFG